MGGLKEAPRSEHKDHTPYVAGHVVRQKIDRTNDFKQAGERWRSFEDWERDELISNLVDALKDCNRDIQERMVYHFTQADQDYGRRVAEGIGLQTKSEKAVETISNAETVSAD
jgi:catalase